MSSSGMSRRTFLVSGGAAVLPSRAATAAQTSSTPQQRQAPTVLSPEEIEDQVGGGATVSTTQINGRTVTVIDVDRNKRPRLFVSDGRALTNCLVDLTAPGSHLSIDGGGETWAIQNIGYRGRASWGTKDNAISARVENGGQALIDNVYLGDGSVPGRQTGIFVAKPTTGTLRINRVNVQEWPDNGIYGSALGPSNGGGGGTVHISNVLAANNVTSNFRLSDGGSLTSSISVSTQPGPSKGGSTTVRGLWARDGGDTVRVAGSTFHHPSGEQAIVAGRPPAKVSVESSALNTALVAENGGSVSLGSISETTSITVPQGVPASAEAAASGSSGGPVSIASGGFIGGFIEQVVATVIAVALIVVGMVLAVWRLLK